MDQKLMSKTWHRTNIWSAKMHMVIKITGVDGVVCERVHNGTRRGPLKYQPTFKSRGR